MTYNHVKYKNGERGDGIVLFENRVLRLAICDDEKALCGDIESKLERVANQLNIQVQTDVWFAGEGIRDYLAKENHIDVIFLDIELMKLTGIDVGNYIRNVKEDIKTQIVYISSKTSYALKLFKTQPFDFLIKPITEEQLYDVMKRLLKVLKTQNYVFEYQNGKEIFHIDYDDIVYFKSDLHKVVIVTMHEEMEFYGKLQDIIAYAPPQFLAIHKSYLINQNYVEKYTYGFVEMKNNNVLNISKSFQKEVREKLSRCRRGISL